LDKKLSVLLATCSAGGTIAAVRNLGANGIEVSVVANQPLSAATWSRWASNFYRGPSETESYLFIKRLLAINGQQGGPLSGLIDPAQIAAAGQSDGGDTVAALVGNTCCLDHKVVAAMVLSGAEVPPPMKLRGTYFPSGTPPILFVQGTDDNVNPPSASLAMYQADTGPRFYLELYGASHLPPYEGSQPPEPLVARVTTEFLNRYVAGQRAAGAAMTRAADAAGVANLVRGGQLP